MKEEEQNLEHTLINAGNHIVYTSGNLRHEVNLTKVTLEDLEQKAICMQAELDELKRNIKSLRNNEQKFERRKLGS